MSDQMEKRAYTTLLKRNQKSLDRKALEESGDDSGTCSDYERVAVSEEDVSSDFNEMKFKLGQENGEEMVGDRLMKFHLGEEEDEVENGVEEESFAGRRYIGLESSTIRSSRGSIRGVKNRVRAGIATFLHVNLSKTWKEREIGQVVVYTTTMGVIRDTYQRCLKVRHILRTHLIKYTEKDVFMSRDVQNEIKERMGSSEVQLPQVFVEGVHLGDAETLEKLNESGELRTILKPYKSKETCGSCGVCGGYRLLPCALCNGSKKSIFTNHFNHQPIPLKCMNCDEVGLVRCYAC